MVNNIDNSLTELPQRVSISESPRRYSTGPRLKFRRAFRRAADKVMARTDPRYKSWDHLLAVAEERSAASPSPGPATPIPRPVTPQNPPMTPEPRPTKQKHHPVKPKPKYRPAVPYPTDTCQPFRIHARPSSILTTSRVDTPHIQRHFSLIAPPRFQSQYPERHQDFIKTVRGFRDLGFDASEVAHFFSKDNKMEGTGRFTVLFNEYPNMSKALQAFEEIGFKPLEVREALRKNHTDPAALNVLYEARVALFAMGLEGRRIVLGLLQWGPFDPELTF
ncbi:hypothetical protein F5Y03DRAFT_411366 [Xylaria venustula]|nr:hypothetical protein F5Y03DRAFT_411366 [Xylaria venustula]